MTLKIHFTCGKDEAKSAYQKCLQQYGQFSLKTADVQVVLGGDGSILKALHQQIKQGVNRPIFGLNFGTRGWMANNPDLNNLPQRIENALSQEIIPLKLEMTSSKNGRKHSAYAFNEFAVLRQTPQSAHLKLILRDDNNRATPYYLVGDGVAMATKTGSSAYYSVIGGQPLPPHKACVGVRSINTESHLSAILSEGAKMAVNKLQGVKRPIMIEGDGRRYGSISRAVVQSAPEQTHTLLFDNSALMKIKQTKEK